MCTAISSPATPPPGPVRVRPVARNKVNISADMPGDVAKSPSISQCAAAKPVSSCSSRAAAAGAVSAASVSPINPAGSSILRAPWGTRYCSTSTISRASVSARMTAAPPLPRRAAYSQLPVLRTSRYLPRHSTVMSGLQTPYRCAATGWQWRTYGLRWGRHTAGNRAYREKSSPPRFRRSHRCRPKSARNDPQP